MIERYEKKFPEKITKKKVVRDGKRQIKYTTDKEGYKIVMQNGKPKEVKMDQGEIRKRSKSAKKGAKKAKTKSTQTSAKRKRSIAKRGNK